MKFSVPKPPSVNHLYGRRGYRTYITPKGEAWFQEAGYEILRQVPQKERSVPIRECEVRIKAYIIQGDVDNLLKASNDLLTKVKIIEDDRYIIKLWIEKERVRHRSEEKLEVEVIKL